MAKVIIGGRPSKTTLGRMKIVTIGVSIAAFLGSLGVIAGNGATVSTVATSQVAFAASTTSTSSSKASAATRTQQRGFSAPLTRSRGS